MGLTWDTADDERFHSAPKSAITITVGAGYRFRIGRNIDLGARIDLAYLEEDSSSQIGWITPGLFAGMSF